MVLTEVELVRRTIISGDATLTLGMIKSLNVDLNRDRLSNGGTFLHEAVIHKHSEITVMLLKLKAKPNKRCYKKLTPLHIAIRNNSIDIIRILLAYGAKFNKKYKGKTPLQLAIEANKHRIAKILLEKGASMNISSGHPGLLEIAIINKNVKIIRLLHKYKSKNGVIKSTPDARKKKHRVEQSLRISVLKNNAFKSLRK